MPRRIANPPAEVPTWTFLSNHAHVLLCIVHDPEMRLAEIARSAQPGQAEFHDTLGWIYYRKGMTSQAMETLQRAVQLAPKDPAKRLHLGLAYVKEGLDPKAREELQEALKLDPKMPQADVARQALAKLVY